MVEQCRDPVSIAWTTVPVPYAESDAEEFGLHVLPAGWADGSEWGFAVEFEGRYAGTISLRDEGPGRAEIAYGSHPDVRGTGTMLRALRLLVDWGFAELDLETIVWQAFTGNWPSRKVAWRLGVTVEGTLRRYLPQRGARRDAWIGTLLKDDPREPRSTWLDVPELIGDGFRLRPVRESDAPRIHEGTAEPATEHWLGHKPAPYTLDDAQRYVERRQGARRDRRVRHLGDRGPRRRSDPRHGAVVQLDAGRRVRGRLVDPPGRARPRSRHQGGPAGGRARLRDAWASSGSPRTPRSTTPPRATWPRPSASVSTASSGTARASATAGSTWPSTT